MKKEPKFTLHACFKRDQTYILEFLERFETHYFQQMPFSYMDYEVYYLLDLDIPREMELDMYFFQKEGEEPLTYSIFTSVFYEDKSIDDMCQEVVGFVKKEGFH